MGIVARDTPVLVTGVAGFIGMHVARRLLDEGVPVTGIDSMNAYYDPALKTARLAQIREQPGFRFVRLDLAERDAVARLFAETKPAVVVHLAAQAGVRYSFENPLAYVDSNLLAFGHVPEGCRDAGTRHLVYASTSSVYGANTKMPFSVHDNVDHPVSLYAATKKANELMAHAYSSMFALPVTGLRFFTVYGPWGRPDMAPSLFASAIREGRPIRVFNHGRMKRDFTYIDDIVEGVRRVMDKLPEPDPAWSGDAPDPGTSPAPYRVYNIGNNEPVALMRFIGALESAMGAEAQKEYVGMQPGDVEATYADIDDLVRDVDFRPATPIDQGVRRFVDWFDAYRAGTVPASVA